MKNSRGTSNIRNQLFLAVGVFFALFIFAIFLSLRWVDKQEIPTASDARNTLRFVAAVYPLLPGECDEKCVIRTIKIANLVALSEYGKKSPVAFSNDISMGYSLLNTILIRGDLPDRTAEYEVALERLLFFNRMNALAMDFGHRLDGGALLRETVALQGYAYDEETKGVLRREAFIFNTMQNNKVGDIGVNFPSYASELTFTGAYQLLAFGLALCAVRDDIGSEYIRRALPFLKINRENLSYSVARNLDAPLIALAEKHAACQGGTYEFKTLLGD